MHILEANFSAMCDISARFELTDEQYHNLLNEVEAHPNEVYRAMDKVIETVPEDKMTFSWNTAEEPTCVSAQLNDGTKLTKLL